MDSEGFYSFESVCSGLMLASADAAGGFATQTARLDSAATDAQKWKLSGNPSGGFRLVSKTSGLALDLKGGDTYDGNVVQVYGTNGSSAQGLVFKQPASLVSDGYYTVDFWATVCGTRSAGGSAMSLDVTGASRDAGANVQLFIRNGTRAQTFHIRPNGDGTYTFNIPFSRKALDVRYGGMGPGTNVQQWDCNGSDGQKWRIEYDGAGAVRIVSVLNGLALDIADGIAESGTNVQVYTRNNSTAQRFMLTPTTYVPDDFSDYLAHFSTVSTNTFNGWYNSRVRFPTSTAWSCGWARRCRSSIPAGRAARPRATLSLALSAARATAAASDRRLPRSTARWCAPASPSWSARTTRRLPRMCPSGKTRW